MAGGDHITSRMAKTQEVSQWEEAVFFQRENALYIYSIYKILPTPASTYLHLFKVE